MAESSLQKHAAAEPLGWAVAFEDEDEIYVVTDERRFAYIAELFVVESGRRQGIGRALISACECWARERALKVIAIGSLAGNTAAFEMYRACGYSPCEVELRKRL